MGAGLSFLYGYDCDAEAGCWSVEREHGGALAGGYRKLREALAKANPTMKIKGMGR
ncbi:hypothetical protein LCGC14_2666570, partial [marine sediment metagenome]